MAAFIGLVYGDSHHSQQYFSYIVAVSFIGGGNRSTRRKPLTSRRSLTNFITKVVNSNSVRDEVFSIQHYVIKFVSDLQQVHDFLWILQFPPPIKLTTTISLKNC